MFFEIQCFSTYKSLKLVSVQCFFLSFSFKFFKKFEGMRIGIFKFFGYPQNFLDYPKIFLRYPQNFGLPSKFLRYLQKFRAIHLIKKGNENWCFYKGNFLFSIKNTKIFRCAATHIVINNAKHFGVKICAPEGREIFLKVLKKQKKHWWRVSKKER